jgi:hypothetical protein
LISAGTERMLVDFGKAGLIGSQEPERDAENAENLIRRSNPKNK